MTAVQQLHSEEFAGIHHQTQQLQILPAHPGYLNDCIFGQYPEYSGYYSTTNFHLTGIKVDNVYNLTIGEPGDEYSNSFAHLQFGIKTNNSLVNIFNNHFSDINSTTYGASYME